MLHHHSQLLYKLKKRPWHDTIFLQAKRVKDYGPNAHNEWKYCLIISDTVCCRPRTHTPKMKYFSRVSLGWNSTYTIRLPYIPCHNFYPRLSSLLFSRMIRTSSIHGKSTPLHGGRTKNEPCLWAIYQARYQLMIFIHEYHVSGTLNHLCYTRFLYILQIKRIHFKPYNAESYEDAGICQGNLPIPQYASVAVSKIIPVTNL